MESGSWQVITAAGTPYEIGRQHGSQAKEKIALSLATYRSMFWDYARLDWETALRLAEAYIPQVEKYDAAIMEEIRGVADGAGRQLGEIMALNARSELALTEKMLPGCTAFAVLPEASALGETYVGQNWDWKATQRPALVVLNIRQTGRPNILMVTEAGIIGKIGFNSAGIAVCLNALVANKNDSGVPLHIVLRGILNGENLGDAIAAVSRLPIASAANFLVGHRDGEAIDIEAAPADYDVLHPAAGLLTHTNHFTSLRLAGVKDIGKIAFADSAVRYGRVNNLLRAKRGCLDLPALQEIMRDHFNYPDSICRHEDQRDEAGRRVETVFSVLMDPARQEMHLTEGPPCRSEYRIIRADF